MAILVPTIYNAAASGMVAGLMAGRANTDTTAGDYAAFNAAAVVFATALDTSVGADATLASAGATIVASTAATFNAGESRPAAMQAFCRAYWEGRSLNGNATDTTAATYTVAVGAIKAVYGNFISAAISNV